MSKILGWLLLLAVAAGIVCLLVVIVPIVLPWILGIGAVAYGVWLCNGPRGK